MPRYWNRASLAANIADGWRGDDYALFRYSAAKPLALQLKQDNPRAIVEAGSWLVGTMPALVRELQERNCRYILAVPGSQVGPAHASAEVLCSLIAANFPWLKALPGALRRTSPVTSGYRDRVRPTFQQHVASLRYVGPKLASHRGKFSFVVFDDVQATSRTIEACRSVLMDATGCLRPIGLFICRTKYASAVAAGVKPTSLTGGLPQRAS